MDHGAVRGDHGGGALPILVGKGRTGHELDAHPRRLVEEAHVNAVLSQRNGLRFVVLVLAGAIAVAVRARRGRLVAVLFKGIVAGDG